MTVLRCAGVTVDPDTKTVFVLDRLVPAVGLMYSMADPGGPRDLNDPVTRVALDVVYAGRPDAWAAAAKRPRPAMPESCHFNILCENGWYVDVVLWPEDDELGFGLPPAGADPLVCATARDLLATLDEVSTWDRYEPADKYDDPFSGLTPGEWLWQDETAHRQPRRSA